MRRRNTMLAHVSRARKWIGTGVLVVAAVGALSLTTAASASTTVHHAPRVACTEISAGEVNLSTKTASVWWKQHTTDCGFYIRVKIKCFTRFQNGVTEYGGFVKGLYPIQSAQHCPNDHPSLQYVYQQVKFSANGSKHTCERYPTNQCATSDVAQTYTYFHG